MYIFNSALEDDYRLYRLYSFFSIDRYDRVFIKKELSRYIVAANSILEV